MKKKTIFLLLILVLIPSLLFAIDDKTAKAIFESKCSICHSLDWPLERRKTADGWKETVKRMRSKTAGNVISNEDEKIIVEYLTNVRGK